MDVKINYIPDKEINIEKGDLLGAKPYVEILYDILEKAETPFTIGLFGGWGVGKSSMIKTIKERFNNDRNSGIAVFVYDAWKYSTDSFRRNFLLNFLEFFNLNTKEVKSRFYANKTQNTTLGISKIFNYQKSKSVIYDKIIEPEIFEGIFKEAIQQIINNKKYSWKYFKEFVGFSRKIKKIVIVIDNIDRCHKDLAFELLLTIKNFLEQKGVVFIIPIDETELKKYIKSMGYNPNEFLRKLFNTTIYIKSFSEGDLFHFAKRLNDDYKLNFPVEVISIIAQQFSKNPRKIIQFLNVLQTELLLAEKQENENLIPRGAIIDNLPFFTKLLIIREEWPDLYHLLKEKTYFLEDTYKKIEEKNGRFFLSEIEINENQRNFLRRTNHIKSNNKNFEIFFINKDFFQDIPDKTNKLVESNDIKGIKNQLNNREVEFNKLIEFIDYKFEISLKRGEIKTTIVNLISLILGLALDEETEHKIRNILYSKSKFLGGFKSFIDSISIKSIINDIDSQLLLRFSKKYKNLSKNIINIIISQINSSNDKYQLIIDYIRIFEDEPDKLKKISKKFSTLFSKDYEFANKVKPILKKRVVIRNLIEPLLINDFIEKFQNNIDDDDSNHKLDIISIYHSEIGLTDEQIEKLVTKIVSFANSDNDFVNMPFWLKILNEYIPDIENESILSNIYNMVNQKQTWLWNNYGSHWNRDEYRETLKVFIKTMIELYSAISNQNQESQLLAWMNQYFMRNESTDLIKYISLLYYEIVDKFAVYQWPFAQNVINRFNEISDWETKKVIAILLNLMLKKTTKNDGLNEQQIQRIYRNYINSITEENQDEIIIWISDTLKNTFLYDYFEAVINSLSDDKKFEIIELLKVLGKNDLIKGVITIIITNMSCNEIEYVFERLNNKKIDEDIIRKSIKMVLRNIDKNDENFECLLEFLSTNKISDNVIHNLIAEKVKNLLASGENDEVLFALKILDKIKVSDARKLNAIKTLVQDINEDDFTGNDLKFVRKMKKKYK